MLHWGKEIGGDGSEVSSGGPRRQHLLQVIECDAFDTRENEAGDVGAIMRCTVSSWGGREVHLCRVGCGVK